MIREQPINCGKLENIVALNFDPYDSSHAGFSESYTFGLDGNSYREKSDQHQFRFRERLEKGMCNPEDPLEYRTAMAENGKKLRRFLKDGKFCIDEYIGSEEFYEREQLIHEKLLRKIARDINRDISKSVAETASSMKVTRFALEKAEYAARSISSIAAAAGRGEHYEIGMYMIDDSLVGRKPDITIRDVYIAEQIVWPDFCDIIPSGKEGAMDDAIANKKRFAGWAHSHADIKTFFSIVDDRTILKEFRQFGIKKRVELQDSLANGASFSFFNGFVVNEKGDEPAFRTVCQRPRAYFDGGEIRYTSEVIDFERTASEDNFYGNKWPFPVIVEDDKKFGTEEMDIVNREIIGRVIFEDGVRLKDLFLGPDIIN